MVGELAGEPLLRVAGGCLDEHGWKPGQVGGQRADEGIVAAMRGEVEVARYGGFLPGRGGGCFVRQCDCEGAGQIDPEAEQHRAARWRPESGVIGERGFRFMGEITRSL